MRHPNQTTGPRLHGRGYRSSADVKAGASWWLTASRDTFSQQAARELPRMQLSKFHQRSTNDGTALYPPSKRGTSE